MPLLTVTTPQALGAQTQRQLADALALVLTDILGVPTELLWVHFTHPDHVQEGLHAGGAAPHTTVTVVANPRPDAVVARALHRIADVLLPALKLPPELLWISWTDQQPGRTLMNGVVS